jgi:histidine triad (HIT) family protein
MNNCVFCKVIAREIPSTKIYEDDEVYALLDINPNAVGHTLVVPKKHFKNIFDSTEEALAQTIVQVKKIAGAIKEALDADGVNIAINNGQAAGQVVFHLHIHIIPRFNGDHEKLGRHITYKEGEAVATAEKIIAALS